VPFILLLVGLTLLFAAVNNTQKQLFALVQGDFTGTGSFIYWLAAIAVVGGVGYVPQLRGLSHAFLFLILVVLILHQDPSKLFGGITNALASTTVPGQPANNNGLPNTQLPELPGLSAAISSFGPNIAKTLGF
jgi:hypothetical protein